MIFVYIAVYIEGAYIMMFVYIANILKELLYCIMIFVYIAIYIEGASLLFNDICIHSYVY